MSAVLRAIGEAFAGLADRVRDHCDEVVRHAHRPHEVGPPENLACFRCMEPWPCMALAVYESRREDQK